MNPRRFVTVVAVMLAALAHCAPNPFDYKLSNIMLLQAKPVQTDLHITAAQRSAMNEAATANRARLIAYQQELQRQKKTQPDPARMRAYFEQFRNAVIAQLKPAQLQRLREISLQQAGMRGLISPPVVSRLDINSGELTKLREIYKNGVEAISAIQRSTAQAVMKPYKGLTVKTKAQAEQLQKKFGDQMRQAQLAVRPRLTRIANGARDKMMAVLTPRQRLGWKQLQGRHFSG